MGLCSIWYILSPFLLLVQKERKSSMAGSLFDNFVQTTEAWNYLDSRKKIGAGTACLFDCCTKSDSFDRYIY